MEHWLKYFMQMLYKNDAPQINWNLNHKHKALKIGSQDCM